jgi:membrane protein DedA with SNARE-associated domain
MLIKRNKNINNIHPIASEEREDIAEARRFVDKWKKRTIVIALLFIANVGAVTPFLAGHSLHKHFDHFGKYLILVCMALWVCLIGAGGLTYNFWRYWRKIKCLYIDNN